jgi:hypothetical protein
MWKKLRGKDTAAPIRVGSPKLLESTYDQGQLERAETIQAGRNYGYIPNRHPQDPPSSQREADDGPARIPTMQL